MDLTVGSVFKFEYPNLRTMTLPSLAMTGRCLVITKAWRTRIYRNKRLTTILSTNLILLEIWKY